VTAEGGLRTSWQLALALVAVMLVAGCGSGSSPASSPSGDSASPSIVPGASGGLASGLPPIVDPTPASPTPGAVIDAFLAGVRSPTMRFHVEAAGSYVVGSRMIHYVEQADANGADRSIRLDETIDGHAYPQVDIYVGGLLYARGGTTQAWKVDGSSGAAQFGASQLQLGHTLVLGDLGAVSVGGQPAYRLRVASGVDLFPPQLVDGTVAEPHNQQGRLEFTIDPNGVLLSAHETRSVEGTIDGAPDTASGTMDFQFSQFGSAPSVVAPTLDAGTTVPTPQPSPSPLPATWTTPTPGDRGFTVSFPEAPTESSGTSTSVISGGTVTIDTRVVAYPSGLHFYEEDAAFPAAFLATTSVPDVLAGSQRSGLAQTGGQLVGSMETMVAGQRALSYVIATQANIYRVNVFLVGNRLVVMSVVGSVQDVGSPAADRFLGSVTLGN
jgi:hypothetical protein